MKKQHLSLLAAVEFKKSHHLKIQLIPLSFLFILFLWAYWINRNPTPADQAQGYSYIFYQLPILNCILMPILIAVIASRLCDMEVNGQTLKLLYTLQTKRSFYDLKFLHEFLYLLLFTVGEGFLILFCGKHFGFTEVLSLPLLFLHMGITLLVGSVILTLQHILSLLAENQIIPLIVGLCGSFLGLFSMFFPPAVARFVLWGYFGFFTPFGMDWNPDTRVIHFYPVPFPLRDFIFFSLLGILFYFICRHLFFKKEV